MITINRNGYTIQRLAGVAYNEDPRPERFVFVCGLHRSGTSLLEHALVSHLELSCLRMTVPESEGQHAQAIYSPASRFGGPGRFAFSHAMEEELEGLSNYDANRNAILAEWRPFVFGSFPTLIEKSPPNLTKIWWLRRCFPGAKFIILARNPMAVAGATQKWSGTTIEELMMHWSVAYSMALRDMDARDCMTIRYEDFVTAPGPTIENVANFLGIARRIPPLQSTERFAVLTNSNDKYLSLHDCRDYGRGAWDAFGYGR